jgi:HlyD family secretion protein
VNSKDALEIRAEARRSRKPFASNKVGAMILASAVVAFVFSSLLPKPLTVETSLVTRGPLAVNVVEEGRTRIRNRYVVSPNIAGFLQRVPVRAGDPVVAGQTLLATVRAASASFLDPRARAQAEAAAQSANAVCLQRNEQVNSAAAELDLGQRELARARKLKETGAIAVQALDLAANRVEVLEDQLASAKFALKVAEHELEQAKAALVHGEDERVDSARLIEIRSPVTGCVLNVFEESARVVAADTPLMEVGDPRDLEIEVELLSTDAVNVKRGANVSVERWGGDVPLRGKVVLVEPGAFLKVSALGIEEQRVKVRVSLLDLPENVLGDRYRIEARITTWSSEDVLRIPSAALFRRGKDWMTFAVENNRAKLTRVSVDHNNGAFAEVKNGIGEGQRVILYPADTIEDDISVRILPESQPN